MLNKIDEIAKKIKAEKREIKIISHHDTDGITSAAILATALKKLDKEFSIKIVKQLEAEFLETLPKESPLVFLDLGSGSIKQLNKMDNEVYILDHHEIDPEFKPRENLHIANPHLFEEEPLCGACLTYLLAKKIDPENQNLANLAIIGMVGDFHDKIIGKISNEIIKDADMIIKKGLLLYPATRPINKTLEYSSGIFIPGVTGSGIGAVTLLKEIGIEKQDGKYKTILELDEDEMSKLITAILLRTNQKNTEEIIGNIYLVKFNNKLEDARELSAIINACSRLDKSHIAFSLCIGNKETRKRAEKIYVNYKQHIISGLNFISNNKKIEGKDYLIINAKDNIKDTIVGTLASILSMSYLHKEGTVIVTMAYNGDKIKISARVAHRAESGRNVREILNTVIQKTGGETGGHALAAGCIIPKEKEYEFIDLLKKQLDIQMVKI